MTDIATTTDMTEEEGARLIELEREVERAMRSAGRIAGAALAEILERRLYRASHSSFEGYLLERHGLSRSTGYRMIAVAKGETNGLPPETAAIGATSAKAAARRHVTLDQPPATIDPRPEPLQETPERHEEDEDEPERPEATVTPLPPLRAIPAPENVAKGTRRGAPPEPHRAKKMDAREDLNRLSVILSKWQDDLAFLAATASRTERLMFERVAAACVVEDRKAEASKHIASPEECDHPVTRIVGNQCGKCGAIRKAAKR